MQATARAVLERVGRDAVLGPLLDSYLYATRHHYRPRLEPLDWQTTLPLLLADLVDEPRAAIYLKGPYPSASIEIDLNCDGEIVKEKMDGKRRSVPKAGERSAISLSARARHFLDPSFTKAYLDLLADLFAIIGGEYGHAEHIAVKPWANEYDHLHWDPFEPSAIAWANFLGPELVARFGRERLLGAPAHQVRELPGGSVVLTVGAGPTEQFQPEVQVCIAGVKAHLGLLSPSERAAPDELAAFQTRSAAAQAETKRQSRKRFARPGKRPQPRCSGKQKAAWREYRGSGENVSTIACRAWRWSIA